MNLSFHRSSVRTLLAGFIVLAAAVGVAKADLVQNPDFVSTNYSYPGYTNYPSPGNNTIADWTGTPLIPTVSASGSNTQGQPFWDNGTTPAGVTSVGFLQLDASFTQSIAGLVLGQEYKFSFLYNARGGNPTSLSANLGDQTLFGPTTVSAVGGSNPFDSYSTTFVYDGSSPDLVFTSMESALDGTSLITDVDLKAVPEPSSLILLGTGVVAAAIAFRRRITTR